MVEQMVEGATLQQVRRGRTFRLDEAERVVQEIISEYGLGYTEMTVERVGGKVRFVRFEAVLKVEEG
jgi:hypothetical protein